MSVQTQKSFLIWILDRFPEVFSMYRQINPNDKHGTKKRHTDFELICPANGSIRYSLTLYDSFSC